VISKKSEKIGEDFCLKLLDTMSNAIAEANQENIVSMDQDAYMGFIEGFCAFNVVFYTALEGLAGTPASETSDLVAKMIKIRLERFLGGGEAERVINKYRKGNKNE
jgi:hypothetical protein